MLGRTNILRNIVSRTNLTTRFCVPFRGFAFKSSEMICARNYDILAKENSNKVDVDQWGYFAKLLHSIWISGGWVLNGNISYNKLKSAIEDSLYAFPWMSGRISHLTDKTMTIHCNNQGIKLDVVCHPDLSLDPSDYEKYNNLQDALQPSNRNIFFTDDKPLVFYDEKDYEECPIITIQLNYLNKENIEDDDGNGHGSVITFKMSHGFADGYTGHYYMKYLSDYLCAAAAGNSKDLYQYNNTKYGQTVDYSFVDTNMSDKDFEKKWGINDTENGKEVLPYFILHKYSDKDVELTKEIFDGFADSLKHEMEYFTLRFTQKDINEIRKKLISEMNVNYKNIKLNTFETIVSYLSVFIAKYECQNGLLNNILIPFNLRDRVSIFDSNTIGTCVTGFSVGIDDNMEYNASSFALKINDCFNIYTRKNRQVDIYSKHDNDYWKLLGEFSSETAYMYLNYSYKYNFWQHIQEAINCNNIMMNEFRTTKLYDNYSFGLKDNNIYKKPLYYMNGTDYTVHRFMLLPTPDDDGVLISIRMPYDKTKKFRENEKEFFNNYEEKQPLNLHEKIYN